MALPTEPPKYPGFAAMLAPISRESSPSPWATYALQRAVGVVPATGVFGSQTFKKVKAFQTKYGLYVDGIAGSKTQGKILELAGAKADLAHGLWVGVGYGFAMAEGGGCLAATNWSIPGSVDCGPAQWRIPGPPFAYTALIGAFRPYEALDRACRVLAERWTDFRHRNRWLDWEPDVALRVAVLAHNAPYGGMANTIVDTYPGGGEWWRYVTRPDDPATWIKNKDGTYPFTRSEWAAEYPTRILKYVA
jgi:peptidoglycan hydrolase-like protein with peptidoglycan-binding domain